MINVVDIISYHLMTVYNRNKFSLFQVVIYNPTC